MKATIKIPRGWRRMRVGVFIKTDRYFSASAMRWLPIPAQWFGFRMSNLTVIRRIANRAWCPKGYVEVTLNDWHDDNAGTERSYRYVRKGTRRLLTYDEWLVLDGVAFNTRFFRPAKAINS